MTNYEPYIVQLELDSRSHLIVNKSDGIVIDVGYMPTESIDIHVTRKEAKES